MAGPIAAMDFFGKAEGLILTLDQADFIFYRWKSNPYPAGNGFSQGFLQIIH
jgi:hypothetical protein